MVEESEVGFVSWIERHQVGSYKDEFDELFCRGVNSPSGAVAFDAAAA